MAVEETLVCVRCHIPRYDCVSFARSCSCPSHLLEYAERRNRVQYCVVVLKFRSMAYGIQVCALVFW